MKVPEPRRMSSGNYFIQLRLGGQSIPVTAATAKECRRQAELNKAEHRAGKRAEIKRESELTLGETLDRYINTYSKTLSPSTIRGYKMYRKARFIAYQDKRLDDINWQRMIDDELAAKSEKTVKNGWGLVHAALDHIDYPIPKVKLAKAPVNEIAFLQPEEIKPFCAAVKGRSYEIAALLELHGLRLSEVRGLKWENIDIEREKITIRGAMVRGMDGQTLKKTNKNEASSRDVPILIPQLKEALEAVKDKSGLVVKTYPNALLDDVKRACNRAGVTEVTNHGLRHSFASLCYFLGIPERQTMKWGGWSDYMTMHKVYIRLAAVAETDAKKTFVSFFTEKKEENANKTVN